MKSERLRFVSSEDTFGLRGGRGRPAVDLSDDQQLGQFLDADPLSRKLSGAIELDVSLVHFGGGGHRKTVH